MAATKPIQLWPIGDSLTAPYVATLAADLAAQGKQVVLVGTQTFGGQRHEGHGGYRVQQIANALPGYLETLHQQGAAPTAAIVVLGTNDTVSAPYPNIPAIIASWKGLIQQLKSAGVRTIVAATIPQTTARNSPGVPLLNTALRKEARAMGLPLVDLERVLDPANLRDGVHFNAAGATAMGHAIAKVTGPAIASRSTSGSGATIALALAGLGLGLLALKR